MPLRTIALLALLLLAATLLLLPAGAAEEPSPLTLEQVSLLPGNFGSFFPHGDYLYAPENGYLDVISLQNNAYPKWVNAPPGAWGHAMTFSDQYAYLASGWSVIIVSLFDPENPVPINGYSDFEPIGNVYPLVEDVAVHGETLYVSLDYFDNRCPLAGKLAILDVSDPLNPVRVGTQEYPYDLGDIEVVRDKLLVLDWDYIHIYDLAIPSLPTLAGTIVLDFVHHDGARLRIAGEHALINYGEVSYPCFSYGQWMSVAVDVSRLPAASTTFSHEGYDRWVRGYADGYLFATGSGQVHIYRFPDFTTPAASLDAPLSYYDIHNGYLQSPSGGVTTLRLSAVSETVAPDAPHTLTYTDTLGVTSFDLPAGSVLSPTVVSVLPLPKVDYPPPGRFQRHAFDIRGHLPAEQLTLELFQQPISATLPLPADPAVYPLGYDFLYWDGNQWTEATRTCDTAPNFPETDGNITVTFCKPGKYGLFVPLYDAFLPAVFR